MIKFKKSLVYLVLALWFWGLVTWLWFGPPDYLIGQPLVLYGLLFFAGGLISAAMGLAGFFEPIRILASKNKVLLCLMLLMVVISLFPPDILQPYYPPAPIDGSPQPRSIIPYPIGLPQANAACPNRCVIDVCTRWVPGPSQQCPHPGPGGGCCLEYEQRCDPDCNEPDPTPTYPPSINGNVTCDLWGNNGWCRSHARLVLSASDPQGYSLAITGNAGGPFSCSGSCTIDLPAGSGTATYTVTASQSGMSDSGSTSWKYDPQLPIPNLEIAGTAGLNGWYVSPVNVTVIGSDSLSGLASVSLTVNGGSALPSAILNDGTYTIVVTAIDNAGNTGSITRTISVDTVPPALEASASGESGSNNWYISPVTISAISTDATSGIASTRYRLDGSAWQSGASVAVSTDGDHTVDFMVSDIAGSITTAMESFQIDQTAPASSFTTPDTDSVVTGIVEISGWSNDETSGLSTAQISFDNQTWQPLVLDDDNWTYVWDTTLLPNGRYTILARGTDLAGNREDTARITLVIANLPPKVDIPPSWMIWNALPVKIQPRLIPLGGAQIVIYDPLGRWPARRYAFEPGRMPTSLLWDRRFRDGTFAPPGSYGVLVEAWDVFGNSGRDTGSIVIPDGLTATPTLTATVTLSPTPSQTPRPTPTQDFQTFPKTTPIVVMVAPEPQPVHIEFPLFFLPLIGLIGLFVGLSATSLSDPRPRALRRLGKAVEEIVHRNHIDKIL